MSRKKAIRTWKRSKKRKHIRKKISGTTERPRLAVYRSARNVYAQLIDDVQNKTLTGVSTLSPELKESIKKSKTKTDAAKAVGKALADKAKSLKIKSVVFDRGGYSYHGRVKAVAEGARENGLTF